MLRGESPGSHCKYAKFPAIVYFIRRIYRVESREKMKEKKEA